jgi:GNAT superfamily N-acetyltransferase
MNIRKIEIADGESITALLEQLGYPNTERFISSKIQSMMNHPFEYSLVAENEDYRIVGFISIHIIPQIALEGDFARISYFCVDENFRSSGVGKQLEEYCEKIARENNCDRIEVHCHSRRERAHEFYFRQGYEESPKYLVKKI